MIKTSDTTKSKADTLIYQDFAMALIYFSKGKVNPDEARKITEDVLAKVDLTNSSIAHKGINWLAKETLKRRHIV
ncbi:hypothetical protein BBH88_17840 [Planococcus antarcticus DSM 14505]|uniref:Uncharacterized protein n=1 Tax=Planococcus antarcticus DSM 14505 TaxID=1185653 RepID=A0ABN4RJ29_9BACL|nr:hypothetical protein [Planococcus antarcticus]ANU11983.1 hypothetical protein BBH88_17840 [Planococcus antarcticus DSM 14505]